MAQYVSSSWVGPVDRDFFSDAIHTLHSKVMGGYGRHYMLVSFVSNDSTLLNTLAFPASSEVRATITSKSDTDEEILVLLSRHILDTRKTSDYMALKVQLEDEEVDILGGNYRSSQAISTKV